MARVQAFKAASTRRDRLQGNDRRTRSCACTARAEHPLDRRSCLLALTGVATATLASPGTVQAISLPSDAPLRALTAEEAAAMTLVYKKLVFKTKAPLLLRMAYHDAGTYSTEDRTGGPNASIQYELDRPENAGLKRGWTLINEARKYTAGTPAEALSNADVIALLGAEGVRVCGGPSIPVLVGRPDASAADPTGRLPAETATADDLKETFARSGFNPRELVALSGAHTIGGKGFGDPGRFDNVYYKALLARPWLNKADTMASMIGLQSDHVLPDDADCIGPIKEFAADEGKFWAEFTMVYRKLTELGYSV